jgi:uncharacterized protein
MQTFLLFWEAFNINMESADASLIKIPESVDKSPIVERIGKSMGINTASIQKTIDLMAEGNTIPFIARYRKEVTGALNEIQLRDIQKQYDSTVHLEERKIQVLKTIQEQGKLTPEIATKISNSEEMQQVEDLYLPFKPKLKTLGTKAKERGLEPLADIIRKGVSSGNLESIVQPFINTEKEVPDIKAALEGAVDIIAEDVGSDPEARQITREIIKKRGVVTCGRTEESKTTSKENSTKSGEEEAGNLEGAKKTIDPLIFQDYFDFSLDITQLKPHQILAINRGEDLGILDIDIATPDEELIGYLRKKFQKQYPEGGTSENIFSEYFTKAVDAGYKRYIQRSIKREIRSAITEEAEQHAIKVFATNLKNLLMTPPLKHRAIIGIDPGYRTGCKIAVIDAYGKFLAHDVIYPHPPQKKYTEAKVKLWELAQKYNAYTFATGNGTASRETEQLLVDLIKDHKENGKTLEYAIVDESGASIYSASDIAIEEFPNLDLTVRGAISIARRLQDPLSELIKIDPKSIGVGMYQHDVNQTALKAELDAVIEDCVNGVGVDLNTASFKLLEFISGLNKRLARSIVETRENQGPFQSREQLKKIKGLGPKAFEQAAGFLKIRDAPNYFDRTFLHPESYELAEKILASVHLKPEDIITTKDRDKINNQLLTVKPKLVAKEANMDPDRIRYLVEQLIKPDLDPRDALPPPILRQDVLSMDDLKPGMIVKGTVRNVVDFGAFVDIGVKISGLVHKSELANRFVKDVHEVIAVGDIKDFMILSVEKERSRIQLSLKQVKQSTPK